MFLVDFKNQYDTQNHFDSAVLSTQTLKLDKLANVMEVLYNERQMKRVNSLQWQAAHKTVTGLVHPKMKILFLITAPHVVPNT